MASLKPEKTGAKTPEREPDFIGTAQLVCNRLTVNLRPLELKVEWDCPLIADRPTRVTGWN